MRKRYSNGLQFNTNYTWQKSLDGQSSLAESSKTQDPFNRRADYSRSTWDINHVFNFAYLYELPFGKGRKWGANWAKASDLVLGGWSVEGITRLETGPPFNVSLGIDRANTGRSTQRPNLVGDPNAGPTTVDQWFNTAAFAMPADNVWQCGRVHHQCRWPRQHRSGGGGKFPIRGSHALEFRTEFFNVPNTVNFSDPIGAMNNANFGRITSQRTPPRQIQFSLRYRF